jgi:arylsulfatase A-like enzyme
MQLLGLGLFCLLLLLAGCSKQPTNQEKPPIILIVLDTLRADHLGAYGYSRPTSPELDAFAASATLYEYAMSPAPWTPPAVASIFSGLYPTSHGMMPPKDRETARKASKRLPDEVLTLAERLKTSGYYTLGLSANPWISKTYGFAQGYDVFSNQVKARAEEVTNRALALLKLAPQGSSPFLYVHYLDPHDPYDPPAPFRTMFAPAPGYPPKMATAIGRYDGEIRYLDQHLGRFFAELKAREMFDKSLIIIVGDHGEQFKEHGHHRHGFHLFNEEIHVPLIVKYPQQTQGKRVAHTVSSVDILPTVLAALKIPKESYLAGSALQDESALATRMGVLAEIYRVYDLKAYVTPEGNKLLLEGEKKPLSFDPTRVADAWLKPTLLGIFGRSIGIRETPKMLASEVAKSLERNFTVLYQDAIQNQLENDAVVTLS